MVSNTQHCLKADESTFTSRQSQASGKLSSGCKLCTTRPPNPPTVYTVNESAHETVCDKMIMVQWQWLPISNRHCHGPNTKRIVRLVNSVTVIISLFAQICEILPNLTRAFKPLTSHEYLRQFQHVSTHFVQSKSSATRALCRYAVDVATASSGRLAS